RRIHNLRLLRHDQVPPAGELLPCGVVCQRGAYGRTMLQVVVGIDVDDLVERTELGMPEGPQFGMVLPQGQPPGKALFKFGHGPGAQGIGPDFVYHGLFLHVTWVGEVTCQRTNSAFTTGGRERIGNSTALVRRHPGRAPQRPPPAATPRPRLFPPAPVPAW